MTRGSSSFFRWPDFAGNRRFFLFCLCLFVVSAFFSFWLFFPADILQRRLVQEASLQTGLEMQGRNASMLFPLGLKLDLSIYPEVPGLTDIELSGLRVTPVLSRLFSRHPEVNLTGALAGGKFTVDAGQTGHVNLQVRNISLAVLQQPDLFYRVSGRLTGQLEGEQISEQMNGHGVFSLQVNDTKLLGLEKIGLPANFSAGVLRLTGRFDQRRFNFEKVVFTGGAIELSGGGNILVGKTSGQTRLNLNVRLHPTSETPESLRNLLNMTGLRPTADGSYLLRIGGTLAKPVIR